MREDGGIINREIDNRRERRRRKDEIEKRKGRREKEKLNKGDRKSMITAGKATKIR